MHPTTTVRLLLVEDEARTAKAVGELLSHSDSPRFVLQHVTTAAAAIDALTHSAPDIILLDLGLPDASELESLARLQDAVLEVPIVVLTGSGDPSLATAALRSGAEDYLLKDAVTFESLLRSIRYAMERHRSVRGLAHMTRQLESANRRLEHLTLIDPLTELLNRRGLQQAVSRELGKPAAAVLVDLDDFKSVNETLGHAVGDVVLKEMSRRLRASVRAIDHVGRIGGDEFLLILPDTEPTEVARVAERIRLTIATEVIQHSGGAVTLTGSVAALLLTPDMPGVDQVLARAHLLLTKAKAEGKNRVVFESRDFDDTDKRLQQQADMCSNLSHGIHLLTVKQPIFRLADESPVGYEFLTRYSNGTYETPDNFFRICSERNVLTLVDHVCLRKAVYAAMQLPPFAHFHLNIFPSTLLGVPIEHLLEIFPKPMPLDTFFLEISEQQIIGDPTYLLEIVSELRKSGLKIAIDDVGYGSSCLESLVVLEPDMIKIDKRCVMGLGTGRAQVEVLRRYVKIGEALGCEVVAEGIETEGELAIVRDLGIEYGQGYLWGMPA